MGYHMKCENEGVLPSFSHFFLIPLFFRSPTIEALSITTKIPLACNLVLAPSQFVTIIYSVDYKDAGQVAGQDTNNVTKQSLSWDQVGTKLGLSRDQVEKLLLSAIQATSAAEIRQVMNMTNATKFKRNYIDPLLELRILAMTQPDSPKSPTQKYYLTELGKQLIKK